MSFCSAFVIVGAPRETKTDDFAIHLAHYTTNIIIIYIFIRSTKPHPQKTIKNLRHVLLIEDQAKRADINNSNR